MSHLSDLLTQWSHQTVTVVPKTTAWDNYGNPVDGTSASYTVLIQQTNRPVRTAQGEEKVSTCQILFGGNTTINIDDKITLPDGQQPLILSIENTVDFDGNREYVKVYT